MLFQWQVVNVSFVPRWLGMGFHTRLTSTPKQTNMETCHVLVVVWCLFRPVKNHVSQNMSLETWTSKPTTHLNISMFEQPEPLKHIPIKTCNISRPIFRTPCTHFPCSPVHPSSMFPHVIPIHAPWPIHEVLDLFQLHIVVVYFSTRLWCLHYRSHTKKLPRVLTRKRAHDETKVTLSFHPH
jgi:hypothetical protein